MDALSRTCRRIFLRDYRRDMEIGAYESEKGRLQPVSFCAEVWVPPAASRSDRLEDIYDYTAVVRAIDECARRPVCLQETLVDELAEKLLADPRVRAVRVSSCKLEAVDGAAGVGVEVFREKKETP